MTALSNPHQLKKFDHQQLKEMLTSLELDTPIVESIPDNASDMRIISTLIDTGQLDSAIQFLALGLPKREAIWWSYIGIEPIEHNKKCLHTQQGLKNINDWVHAPSEARRQSAKSLSDSLELYTPTSWANMAIFWSGGSITPKGKPEVKATPHMCGQAVSNALILAADQSDNPAQTKKQMIQQGLHIAMGGNGRIKAQP